MTCLGKFISIEGTEGVGKTTNAEFVLSFLRGHGIDVIHTREPGGTPLAEELRAILLAKREEAFDPMAELLTVFAARAQHVAQVVRPALEKGQWVLCDRFTDATFAYQGVGRGLSITAIEQLEALSLSGLKPDNTLLLDIDVEIGLARAKARGELDRFELEQISFFERVRQGYHQRVSEDPNRFWVVDVAKPLADVQAHIAEKLQSLIC